MNHGRRLHARILQAGVCLAFLALGLILAPVPAVAAATFGTVVSIGGQASDIALDEPRGLLYIANFTANRIDVMSLANNTLGRPYSVAEQPGSVALSPDGNFLLVAHFANYVAPGTPANALTLINLAAKTQSTIALQDPPLGVAFGADNIALVVTTTTFYLFDPVRGQVSVLDTIANVTAHTLPVAPANFPPQIIAASLNVSKDLLHIYGLTDTIRFHYDVALMELESLGYTASPPLGPRVVSVSTNGNAYLAGWALFDSDGTLRAQFANPAGTLNVGSHALDSSAGLIYAQIPEGTAQVAAPPANPATPPAPQAPSVAPPILQIVASDNLAVQAKLRLAENLAGKSLLTSKGDMLYSISDSGVTVFPVGYLNQAHRVTAAQPDLVFRSSFCETNIVTQQILISDPGGNHTDFALTPTIAGITVSPSSGTTPATVQVSIDPNVFQNISGTVTGYVNIQSNSAVNIPDPFRVLINKREPDQRGTFVDIPGILVDIAADPVRNRFYVLRQDQNQVLVYDSTSNNQIAILRTSNTPTSMALTLDNQYMIVGHDNSQLAYVFDLDALQRVRPVYFPPGHYPRQIAVSSSAILAATRVAGPINTIDVVDFPNRSASALPTLGVYTNSINVDTVLSAAANGTSILAASADGTVLLYSAAPNTFVTARKDFPALSGAFAASNYGQYIVDNNLLDSSGVLVTSLDSSAGASSGFVFVDQTGLRTTALSTPAPGVISRIAVPSGDGVRPTQIVEAPLMANGVSAFSRTLAPLAGQSGIVSLTTSGFTVLPWDFDAAVAPPLLNKVVSAADFTSPVAPGELVSIFGSQLSQVNLSSSGIPVPTTLGESCLTVDDTPVPIFFVSSGQINAQLPFNMSAAPVMVLRTPGGTSTGFNLTVASAAPSVFRTGVAGPQTGVPTMVRAKNNELVTPSNPIHPNDVIIIFATGLGQVSPAVLQGQAGPADPLAFASIRPAITLGGAPLKVEFAGLAPGLVGVYQINAVVPPKIPTGLSVPMVITQGGVSTTLSVRVESN